MGIKRIDITTDDAFGRRQTVTSHLDGGDVTGKTVSNVYDPLNRLVSVTDWQTQQTVYIYRCNGSLVETTPGEQAGNGTKRYFYNTAGQLIREIPIKRVICISHCLE